MNQDTAPRELRIDIVSDVVCPWCIIGYLQLQKALASCADRVRANIHWQPFELNPRMPQEGQDLREHVLMKYGANAEQSRASRQRLIEIGDSLGFQFDYFDGMRILNTFRAHQLLHWAAESGRQTDLKLALFDAFFRRREDVNDIQTLIEVVSRAGLQREEAAAVLDEARYAAAVREAEESWLDRGIHAVPTFVFEGRYMIAGAQDSANFVRLIERIEALATVG